MGEVVTAIARVTDIMKEISTASKEQSVGIEQVSSAITQMDQVTQQNASLVEEAAAASTSMQKQAAALLSVVGKFTLSDTVTAPTPVALTFAKSVKPNASNKREAMPRNTEDRRGTQKSSIQKSVNLENGDDWVEF